MVDDEGRDKEGKGGKTMAMAISMTGKKECKGNEEGNGVDDEGDVQQRGQ